MSFDYAESLILFELDISELVCIKTQVWLEVVITERVSNSVPIQNF